MGTARTPFQLDDWFVLLVTPFALAVFAIAFKLDSLFLLAVPGVAILAGLFAWSQPFIICALFIAVSYFRLPEAYPGLDAFKPALLLGTASVVLVGLKALLSDLQGPSRHCVFCPLPRL